MKKMSMLLIVLCVFTSFTGIVFAQSIELDMANANPVSIKKIELDIRNILPEDGLRIDSIVDNYVPSRYLDISTKFRGLFWGPTEGTFYSDFYFNGGAEGKSNLSSASFSLSAPNRSVILYVYDISNPTYPLISQSLIGDGDKNVFFDIDIITNPHQNFFLRFDSASGVQMSGAFDIIQVQ